MFGRRFQLFQLFGIPIGVDLSWLVVAVLISWSLATSYFPVAVEGLAPSLYWTIGVAGALGLFASVILHELGHALVARRYGVEIRGITLFLFGGVAELASEPPSPRAELWVAIAGPITSAVLSAVFFAIGGVGAGLPEPLLAVVVYLCFINLMLVVFNLVPAMPLDGGRILRALLWARSGDLRRATRISSQIGGLFGFVLIGLGVLAFVRGSYVAGVWWFMIGLFLRTAAASAYQNVLVRRALEGEPVRRFMEPHPVVVPRGISVRELVEDYVYRHHFKVFPVVDDQERLLGCVSTREIKQLPVDEWEQQTVGAIAGTCSADNTLHPDDDAMDALGKMSRSGVSRMMVVEDGDRLVGILALKDLLRFLALKIELEGGPAAPRSPRRAP